MGHAHGHAHSVELSDPRIARILWGLVGLSGVITVCLAILLWPGDSGPDEDPLLLSADPISAKVITADEVICINNPSERCSLVGFRVPDGADADEIDEFGVLELGIDASLSVGDSILVTVFEDQAGEPVYSFYDHERTAPMLWLLGLFVISVLALGRWRGLGAIGGLVFSLMVIVIFTLPAILDGANSVSVALVTASLIGFAALFLAHGFELATAVALLSTLASLVITALLAVFFVGATKLTGMTDDTTALLGGLADGIDPRGILLAGIVIGALGVLDDVTVTQVSAVWELKRVRPDLTLHELVAPALRIGRDHISSTVNTLFLAYAGAALPLLLLFTGAGQGFGNVVTREIVAVEVVRALVGSVGLVASVPISTYLAAIVVNGAVPVAESGAEQ